jgi:dienelactone hydrolase
VPQDRFTSCLTRSSSVRGRAATILTGLVAVTLAVGGAVACGSKSHQPPKRQAQLAAEWGMPTSGRPRALVMLIPGGGWEATGASQIRHQLTGLIASFQKLGYETLAFGYGAGAQGIRDGEMFYRLARKRVGPNLPICALGLSAGGHIAMMLAVMNPRLACVVDAAGPTDLLALAKEPSGTAGYQLAVKAFGARNLSAYSPARHASSIRAKLLMLFAQNDPIVPVAQGQDMARALPGSRLIILPPGPVPFVHSGVAAGPYRMALQTLENFVAQATGS